MIQRKQNKDCAYKWAKKGLKMIRDEESKRFDNNRKMFKNKKLYKERLQGQIL